MHGMMDGRGGMMDGMAWMMGGMGLVWLLIVVLVVLGIAALLKFLFSRRG